MPDCRIHALTNAHQNIDDTLQLAECVLDHLAIPRQVEPRLLEGPQGDFDGYFAAVEELETAIYFLGKNTGYESSGPALRHANSLLTQALTTLLEEFRRTLTENSAAPEPTLLYALFPEPLARASDSNRSVPPPARTVSISPPAKTLQLVPPETVPSLHGTAKFLLARGFAQECTKAYVDVRGAAVLHSLKRLGMAKLTRGDLEMMTWNVLEIEIRGWVRHVRIAVRLLLASERSLCNQVFDGLDPCCAVVFCEVAAEAMATLLSFGDSVAKSKKSPEKLFALLDMYETLRDLLPEMKVTFAGEACATIREAAGNLLKRVAEAALGTFAEFEAKVEKDESKETVGDGNVLPLTKYVIKYVTHLTGYQANFHELSGEGDTEPQQSQLAVAVKRILDVLQRNLDGKAKWCKHPALAQLFMMNNMHYVVSNVKRSEIRELLGSEWIHRQRRTVQQHAVAYQRSSWGVVTSLLTSQGLQTGPEGPVNARAVRDRFKAFNTSFEELYSMQAQWVIPDLDQIREAVRLRIAEVLLPAYRSFLGRYGPALEAGKKPERSIKYRAEDLERMLGNFFEGEKRTGLWPVL